MAQTDTQLKEAVYISTGADPGFFLGGVALVCCSTSTPINHMVFFFCRIPIVLENGRSSRGGGVHPQHPPPRYAPVLVVISRAVLSWFVRNKGEERKYPSVILKYKCYVNKLKTFLRMLQCFYSKKIIR